MELVTKYLIDALYIIVAAITIIVFTKNGFFKTVFRFGKVIAGLVISYFAGPLLKNFIYEKWIFQKIFDSVAEKVTAFLENTVGSLNIEDAIDSLPFIVRQFVDADELKAEYGDKIANIGETAQNFAGSVSAPIANVISNLLGYTIVFLVALFALWVVSVLLEMIMELPVLRTINGVLGAVLGVIAAFLILAVLTWVLGFIIGLVGTTSAIARVAEESKLFGFFENIEFFKMLN